MSLPNKTSEHQEEEEEVSLADDVVIEYDEFAQDPEDEDEESFDIPDFIEPPSKRVTKEQLLEECPEGLILVLNVFCGKCNTLRTAYLDIKNLSPEEIDLVYSAEWSPSLSIQENFEGKEDRNGEVEVADLDIMKQAPALRVLAALESATKGCLAECVHTYLSTTPEVLKKCDRMANAQAVKAAFSELSHMPTSNVVNCKQGQTLCVCFLYVDESLIDEARAKINRHLRKKAQQHLAQE